MSGTLPRGDGMATACLVGQSSHSAGVCGTPVPLTASGHVAASATVPVGTAAGTYAFDMNVTYDLETGNPPFEWGVSTGLVFVNVIT